MSQTPFPSFMVRRPYSDYPPAKHDNDSGYKIDDHGVLEKFYENSSDHPIDENQPIIVSEGSYDSPVVEEVYDLDSEYDHRKAESSDWHDRFKVQITDSPPSSAILISPTEEDVPLRRNNSLPFRRRGGNKENYGTASATNSDYNADNHFIGNFDDGSEDITEKSTSSKSNHSTWNKLNATLFFGHALLSAATSVPVTLVPTMARSLKGISEDDWTTNSPYYTSSGNSITYDGDSTTTATLEVYDKSGTRKRWIPFRIRTKNNDNHGNANQIAYSPSSFASHLAAIVTLATAFGKFINGPLVDLAGARRLLVAYGVLTCLSLLGLRYSHTPSWAIGCCAGVEFFSSILWPCVTVILGAHYGTIHGQEGTDSLNATNHSDGRFERGIYVTSLASRCGSLLAMPLSSLLIKWTDLTWRDIAGLAALAAFSGVIVFYFFLTDSPRKVHDPQNPIRTISHHNYNGAAFHAPYQPWKPRSTSTTRRILSFGSAAFSTILPSLRLVLVSRVFWLVAAAHGGATMVKSSERILGTYYRDTSNGAVTEGKAGAMTVFLSMGMLIGLLFGGRAFALAADGERGRENGITSAANVNSIPVKSHGQMLMIEASRLRPRNMIAFFYCLSICMCYMLSFFAIPWVHRAFRLPMLVLVLQVLTTIGLGAGIAVQYYHIPAIVGATYGKNRGLYTAYTDGVAALVSSMVWRIVGGAVEEGNPQGGGWAYGWAAVALLLVFCGTLMVGIMEVYFVGGGWRHHEVRKENQPRDGAYPADLPRDVNGSWMEEEMRTTGFSMEDSSLRHGGIHLLSSSALEFLSPSRIRRDGKSLLTSADSRDREEESEAMKVDLLGIDDDGSILYPLRNNFVDTPNGGSNNRTELLDFAPVESSTQTQAERNLPRHPSIEFKIGQGDTTSSAGGTAIFVDDNSVYASFRHILGGNDHRDDRIRHSSTFDDPRSDYNSSHYRDLLTPPPIDTFEL
ncbi:hypothetical protein ACHAXS_008099 [Conticribra weissflogii]